MAYVIKIVNVDSSTSRPESLQGQPERVNKELIKKTGAQKLLDAKSENMSKATQLAGDVKAVMNRVGGRISKRFETFKGGGLLANQLRTAGVSAGAATGLAAAAAGVAGVLDIANQLSANVGNFTRNKASQNKVNNTKNAISQAAGIGGKLLLGASAGPVGVAVAIASIAVDYGIKAYNLALEIEERQIEATKASERLGRVVSQRGRA